MESHVFTAPQIKLILAVCYLPVYFKHFVDFTRLIRCMINATTINARNYFIGFQPISVGKGMINSLRID